MPTVGHPTKVGAHYYPGSASALHLLNGSLSSQTKCNTRLRCCDATKLRSPVIGRPAARLPGFKQKSARSARSLQLWIALSKREGKRWERCVLTTGNGAISSPKWRQPCKVPEPPICSHRSPLAGFATKLESGDLQQKSFNLGLLEKVHPLIPPADHAWTATDPNLKPLRGLRWFQALLVMA